MKLASLFLGAAIVAQPTVSPDALEPSVKNEVDHARSRAPAASAASATNALSAAEAGFVRLYETNGLTATDAAIRLVSAQRPDGRWTSGTNDVTRAAMLLLDRLAGGGDGVRGD